MSDDVRPTVTWLPAHPSEGVYSMFTCWRELARVRRDGDPFAIRCPISPDRWTGRPAGRLRRALDRYLLYPAQVSLLRLQGIVHILDHSSAHLLDRLPSRCRTVVTVHDLIPLVDAEGLTERQVARYRGVVERLKRADRLVAVSQYTKGEVVRLLGVAEERIVVVPNGVCHAGESDAEWSGRGALAAWRGRQGGLVLGSVGSALPRKNLGILAEAAGHLASRGVKVALARLGETLPGDLRERILDVLGSGSLFEFEHLDPASLSAFYRAVDVVVVPSRHEGFGLPVLEAMHQGTPVVCSNATSLPEVGGEAAFYFQPDDAQGLADRLFSLRDPHVRAQLGTRSRQRASEFSWRRHLEALYDIYRELTGGSPPAPA